MTERKHWTDEALIAWLDEGRGDPRDHLAGCAACRSRLEAIESVLTALRSALATGGEAASHMDEALAFRRERITEAVRARPRDAGASGQPGAGGRVTIRPIRRWAWAPIAAAAAVAALLVLAPDRDTPPTDGGTPLPVLAQADSAAAEALEALLAGSAAGEPAGRVESLFPAISDESALGTADLEAELAALSEFAALPPDDQAAILEELSNMTFEL